MTEDEQRRTFVENLVAAVMRVAKATLPGAIAARLFLATDRHTRRLRARLAVTDGIGQKRDARWQGANLDLYELAIVLHGSGLFGDEIVISFAVNEEPAIENPAYFQGEISALRNDRPLRVIN